MMNNKNYNEINDYDTRPQNMDMTEDERPSRGYKNYDKNNKTITTKII
jgi:hypothetical protein